MCSPSSPLAVVMVDFDGFGEVNATHGHDIANQVLRRAAGAVREAGISPRLAFRYGGDEFVLLVPGTGDDGRTIAEQVGMAIERQNGDLPSVTVSAGVAALDTPLEPWAALDRADSALHEAKLAGGNTVAIAERATAEDYLLEALEHEAPRRAALALAVANVTVHQGDTVEDPEDVLTLCEAVGRRMGLVDADLDRLLAGAQLHDVGKVAVPPEIFNKPGPLTADERAIIGEQTVIGEGILRSVPEMAEVATIVRHSHEHWDGRGHPDGLRGEQIPLASRIILCASAFRAIRSDRPYRPARSADEAIAELETCAGTQFDPAVVKAFVEVAQSVRRQAADPAVITALPRSRRLVSLLAALAISTGTAFAAIPEVRDLIRSVFGASTGPSDIMPSGDARGFSFGPLGDVLSIKPTKKPANDAKAGAPQDAIVPLSIAVSLARGGDPAAPTPAPETLFGPPGADAVPDGGGNGDLRPEGRDPAPPQSPDPPGPDTDPGPGNAPGGGNPTTPGDQPAPPKNDAPPDPGPVSGPDPVSGPTPPSDPGTRPDPGPGPDPDPGPGPGPGPDPGTRPPPTGKSPPPRKPAEPPSRDDEAHEPGSPGRPDNPGRTDPPGRGPR